MNTRINIDSQLASAIESPLSILTVLVAAVKNRRDEHVAMANHRSNFEGSNKAFAIDGELDGLLRAIALVAPARTLDDWHVKEGELKERCDLDLGEGHDGIAIMQEIPAMLAASLLDDAARLLREFAA